MEHEQAADEAEAQADKLKHYGDQLDEKIETARTDWEAKKADPSVPGARSEPEEDEPEEDEPEEDEPEEDDASAQREARP
jgi:hypothetical protein